MKRLSLNQRFMRACIDKGFSNAVKEKLDAWLKRKSIKRLCRTTKIEKNKIVFLTFSGNYDCNPKAIADEIIKQKLDMNCCWGIYVPEQNISGEFPKEVKTFIRDSYECFKALSSAKVIVDNGVSLAFIGYKKKRKQVLIETWHGSLGIKKFGEIGNNDTLWHQKAQKESSMIDYMISNSDFENSVYAQTEFKTDTEVLKVGHPRNDVLFCDEERRRLILNKIRDRYSIAEDAKLCLYAPTFRDGNSLDQYNLDYDRLKEALKKRFGGKWQILVRFHNVTKTRFGANLKVDNAIDVSGYADIQEILVCIDVGITDYSSWICEYMLRRKPGFIFATDMDEYIDNERKLFYKLEELPFPLACDEKALEQNILSFDEDAYVKKCDEFLKDKGSVDDGHASERVVELIKNLTK